MVRLFELAEGARAQRPDRSRRYVELARRIGMRYQVSAPSVWRRRVCRGCNDLLVPGINARVRMRAGCQVVTCLSCERVMRFPVRRGRIEETGDVA
jgi:ribonuclease P protein subunit RPR2